MLPVSPSLYFELLFVARYLVKFLGRGVLVYGADVVRHPGVEFVRLPGVGQDAGHQAAAEQAGGQKRCCEFFHNGIPLRKCDLPGRRPSACDSTVYRAYPCTPST